MPQSWCPSLGNSRHLIILNARSEYETAVADPSHWIKVCRYGKRKPRGSSI
jgi:hypothetical protein